MKSPIKRFLSGLSRLGGGLIVLAFVAVPAFISLKGFDVGALHSGNARSVKKFQPLAQRTADKQPVRPFDEPIISITFDDGWESVYTDALPILQQDGIPTTQFIIAGEFNDPGYMSYDQVKSLHSLGHEIGSHTMSHPDLTKINDTQLTHELADSRATLEAIQPDVKDFAIPYGSVNAKSLAYIKIYYRSARGSDGSKTFNIRQDLNTKDNFDRYNINAFSVTRNTSLATLRSYIDYTIAHKGWLVLAYHQINSDSQDDYGVSREAFKQQMDMISKTNIRVAPEGAVLDAMPARAKK